MYLEFYNKYKLTIWFTTLVIIISLVVYVLYKTLVFQVTSTNPSYGANLNGASASIEIYYNKNIKKFESNQKVLANANIISSTQVNGKKITVKLVNLKFDNDYQIDLNNITSEDGQVIGSYKLSFKNKYVQYNKQSQDMITAANKATDQGNTTDPALKALPKTTNTFSITYIMYGKPDQKGKYLKLNIALLLPNYEQNDVTKLKAYKTQALDYLKSSGVDPNSYVIEYFPTAATNL